MKKAKTLDGAPVKKRGCAMSFIVISIVLVAFITLVIILANTVGKDYKPSNSSTEKADNQDVQMIIDATGMTLENASKAYEAFRNVSDGLSVIYSVTYDSLLDSLAVDGAKGYRVKTEFSSNVILSVVDGEIYSIRYADYDYFIDGKVNGYFYDRNGKLIAGQKP